MGAPDGPFKSASGQTSGLDVGDSNLSDTGNRISGTR